MKQRSESCPRFNEPVKITAFEKSNVLRTGRFVDLSSTEIKIKSDAVLEAGSLLRLEAGDDLIMTEVRHCERDGEEYTACLVILSWLKKSELKRLFEEALAGPSREAQPRDAALLAVA